MDYPRSIKRYPLRPIAFSRCSVTYGVAKVLTRVLKPLVGKLPHHIQSTRDFLNKVRVTLLPGECLNSYDVSAVFTSIPIDPSLNIILKIYWNRMITCVTGLYCQYRTSLNFWGSVCKIHTSLAK